MHDEKMTTHEDDNSHVLSHDESGVYSPPVKVEQEAVTESPAESKNMPCATPLLLQGIEAPNNKPEEPETEPHFFEVHADASKEGILHVDQTDNDAMTSTMRKERYVGKFILLVCITSCVAILFSSLINKSRQDRFHMTGIKIALEKQFEQLQSENLILEKEYAGLKQDPIRIEKEARDNFDFIAPGEILYPRYNFNMISIAKKETPNETPQNRWKAFLFDGPVPWQFPALIILFSMSYYLISFHYEYRKLH
ncbi:MAG: septum formation initiator family protein [Candidatus Brocadiaceae bacterium]